ncbi:MULTISPECIES: hypothetical protein [Pseudovibrio]|uniref:hypothetical protein n=1 Tax=Stappiaceae TaxID=2821832 RepID=UPI002365116B|nr:MULTISPECIES: hypothetical protein [Pseudovibrio]MDD7908990.1 hypothetical protein [Pseudovibrio exalbescens]MDX5593689.1 hypothetical protein [Pseudovibrio sp. SPO723]
MSADYQIIHRAVGYIDQDEEGHDIRANLLVIVRPPEAPMRSEILYAPIRFYEQHGGIWTVSTAHGDMRVRATTLYGGRRVAIEQGHQYTILMGASGRTARLEPI